MTRLSIALLALAVLVIGFALYQVTAENYGTAGLLAGLAMTLAGLPALAEALNNAGERDDAG
ncbi:hypothetical protein ACRAQ6_10915 [Erythrobacter sp. HA6-11]